jgi:RHS repeat-associated protein
LSEVYYDGEPGSCGGFTFTDPSTQPAPMGMHDASYGINFFYRGMAGTVVTPASTVCTNYDIGGNVTSSSTNGVTTTAMTASGSDYAVPTTMTTGSLVNTMNYSSFLAPTSVTGPNGDTAFIGYDGNARPSSTDSPFGAHTAFVYIDTPLPPPMVIATTSGANTNTHWARTTKDGFGRTIKSETGSGTGSSTATALSVVDTVYAPCGCSPLGKLWKTSMPHAPNATPVWTVYTYDGSGRTLSVTSPDGSSATTYVYAGNTVKVTDPAGKWKTFTMDAMGNLTSVLETDPTFGQVTTSYTYDILNHLTGVSMPRGLTLQTTTTQTRSFNYTSGNTVGAHLLDTTNPENGMVRYTYNTDHTLNTKTDAKNQVFTYGYDGLKRLSTVSVGGNVLRTYSYDTNPYDANYSQFAAGRLTAIQYAAINYNVYTGSPGGSTTFTDMFSYTQPGSVAGKRLRVTKVQPYGNGLPHTQTAVGDLNMTYSYNYEGKLISVTYPTDVYGTTPQFTYSYDAMMRPAGMTDQTSASIVSGVQYGPANELLQMTYIGGATETRQYNSMLQLTNITGLGQNITYTFPPVGQNAGKIASQTDNISGETINYLYDSLNRLISAGATSNAWSQTYAYDGFGNLTGRMGYGTAQGTTIGTPADTTTNRLSGFAYDPNGNQISTGYGYDAENRLVQANAGAIQYGYDAQNKRIWQASFSNSSGDWLLTSDLISMFGIDGKMIGTYNPQPNWNNSQTQISIPFYGGGERVYFGGKLVAKMGGSGYLVSVAQDRLGSVGKYYPFGEERNSPPLPNDQVKFATYTRDSATGLDYADQRHYASTFGRFMPPDPYQSSIGGPGNVADPISWNRYSYTGGDPINRSDASGTCWKEVPYGPPVYVPCPGEPHGPGGPPGPKPEAPPPGDDPPGYSPSSNIPPALKFANKDQQDKFGGGYKKADQLLGKSDCGGMFGADPKASLAVNYEYNAIPSNDGAGVLSSDVWPVTNPDTQTVTINLTGHFMDDSLATSWYGVTLNATETRAFVLLHELGHLTRTLGDDTGSNSSLGDDFNRNILKNCFGKNPTK